MYTYIVIITTTSHNIINFFVLFPYLIKTATEPGTCIQIKINYPSTAPLNGLIRLHLKKYDYIGTSKADVSGFYKVANQGPNLKETYIFKDWEPPNFWIGTVISSV